MSEANEIAAFLTKSGGKLEEVVMKWETGSADEWTVVINALRTSCRKMRKVSLNIDVLPRRTATGDFVQANNVPPVEEKELLISYAAQLEEAELLNLPIGIFEEILANCPNVVACSWIPEMTVPGAQSLDKFTTLAPWINLFLLGEEVSEWLSLPKERELFESALSSLNKLTHFELRRGFDKNLAEFTDNIFTSNYTLMKALTLWLPEVNHENFRLLEPSFGQLKNYL